MKKNYVSWVIKTSIIFLNKVCTARNTFSNDMHFSDQLAV